MDLDLLTSNGLIIRGRYNLRGRGQLVLVSFGIPLRHCVSLYDLGRGVLKRMSVLEGRCGVRV